MNLESKIAASRENIDKRNVSSRFKTIEDAKAEDQQMEKTYGPFMARKLNDPDDDMEGRSPGKRKAPGHAHPSDPVTPARRTVMEQEVGGEQGIVGRLEWSPATTGSTGSVAEKSAGKWSTLV